MHTKGSTAVLIEDGEQVFYSIQSLFLDQPHLDEHKLHKLIPLD